MQWGGVLSIDQGTIDPTVLNFAQDGQTLIKVNALARCDAGIQASETQVLGISTHIASRSPSPGQCPFGCRVTPQT